MVSLKLRKATREFNRFRFPECRARCISNSGRKLVIEFSGTGARFFCCFDEHFEDYRYYLRDIAGLDYKVSQVRKTSRGFRVKYLLEEKKKEEYT